MADICNLTIDNRGVAKIFEGGSNSSIYYWVLKRCWEPLSCHSVLTVCQPISESYLAQSLLFTIDIQVLDFQYSAESKNNSVDCFTSWKNLYIYFMPLE